MSRSKKSVLLPLVAQLKASPSFDALYSGEALSQEWERFRQQTVKNNKPTVQIMAALLLDSCFSNLLSRDEFSQLIGLARAAVDRYEAKNKTTKVGRTLFDAIKENT